MQRHALKDSVIQQIKSMPMLKQDLAYANFCSVRTIERKLEANHPILTTIDNIKIIQSYIVGELMETKDFMTHLRDN